MPSSLASTMSSARSSTLVVTPYLLKPDLMSLKPPLNLITIVPGKGSLQPHHSNLPRRKKRPQVPMTQPPEQQQKQSLNAEDNSSLSQETPTNRTSPPTVATSLDVVEPPFQVSKPVVAAPLQPHVSNLPRRLSKRPSLSAAQLAARRREVVERRRCLQEIARGSGVFVALYDDDQDQEEQKQGQGGKDVPSPPQYAGTVKVCIGSKEDGFLGTTVDDNNVLELYISHELASRDDGVTALMDDQIRRACVYLRGCMASESSSLEVSSSTESTSASSLDSASSSTSASSLTSPTTSSSSLSTPSRSPRVLIKAARWRPVDAIALAVCFVASLRSTLKVPLPDLEEPLPGLDVPNVADLNVPNHPNLDVETDLSPIEDTYTPLHALFMYIHDEVMVVRDDDDDDDDDDGDNHHTVRLIVHDGDRRRTLNHGRRRTINHGDNHTVPALRAEWRGLVSRDGMDRLVGVVPCW